jgi:hypothetical protein
MRLILMEVFPAGRFPSPFLFPGLPAKYVFPAISGSIFPSWPAGFVFDEVLRLHIHRYNGIFRNFKG